MIFGKRINELERQANEFRKRIDDFEISKEEMFDRHNALISSRINDLKIVQKALHDNYCELREEFDKRLEQLESRVADLANILDGYYDKCCDLSDSIDQLKKGMK